MESKGNFKIVISLTGDSLCACRFMLGRDFVAWQDMSRDDQLRAVNAMYSMADMFVKFVKESDR